MAKWADLESDAPEFAAKVRSRFDAGTNKTLATLRLDGSPRISGTELKFESDGRVTLGMMPGSLKLRDVQRDPRVAVHSPTLEPPAEPAAWEGDAKLSGTLVAIDPPDESPVADAGYFELDISEAVLTHLDPVATQLVVESWHPGRGWQTMARD